MTGVTRSFDPQLPEDVIIAFVDGKQWRAATRRFHQGSRNVVVVLHDETGNPVDMFKVVEGRSLIG
jgi:hypothetical protein